MAEKRMEDMIHEALEGGGAKCQIQTNLPELAEEGSIWL
jgi:hypothetical protein